MNSLTIAVFVAICAVTAAHGHHDEYHGHAKYEFKYGVKDTKTGDIKSQWEHRNGDHVKGSYSLKEADVTTRLVDYHADGHGGFHADVKHIGHAHHPVIHQHDHHHDHEGHYHHDNHVGHHHHAHHVEHHNHHAHHHGHGHSHDHGHATSYIDVHHY